MSSREKFEAWVMTEVCISKSTLEGLRIDNGYRNSTLSGTDYNRMWSCWQAVESASEQKLTDMAVQLANADSKCRELAAENATAGQWVVELGDEVYAVDGDDSEQIAMVFSDNGRSDAAFIAAASPVAVLSLLDENLQLQRDKDSLEAVAIAMRDDMRDAREKLEAAEKRIAELESRIVTLPQYRNSPDMHTKQFYEAIGFNQGLDIFIEALLAAGIGVKGE